MIVRALDADGDWTFGKGKNNYLRGVRATQQNLATRLRSFLGDCFFDTGAGIDWFNLLGSKNLLKLQLDISAVILNTQEVTGLVEDSLFLDTKRVMDLRYSVNTIYSVGTSAGTSLQDLI